MDAIRTGRERSGGGDAADCAIRCRASAAGFVFDDQNERRGRRSPPLDRPRTVRRGHILARTTEFPQRISGVAPPPRNFRHLSARIPQLAIEEALTEPIITDPRRWLRMPQASEPRQTPATYLRAFRAARQPPNCRPPGARSGTAAPRPFLRGCRAPSRTRRLLWHLPSLMPFRGSKVWSIERSNLADAVLHA